MQKLLTILNLTLLVGCLGYCVWMKKTSQQIAYVRSAVVVEKYLGMKEARASYEHKVKQWQANIDTLSNRLDYSTNHFAQQGSYLSPIEKNKQEMLLAHHQQELEKYQETVEAQAAEEETKMIQGALNQINSFVKNYADEHGYDVVLGTTQSGNILYANDAIDITDEVLDGLNKNYK